MPGHGATLGTRALNRALLARHHLLGRVEMPALDMVEQLVGMQGQTPLSPYTALWSRLERFRPEEIGDAITDRRAVRLLTLRATIHLHTARDALSIRGLVAPVLERVFWASSPYGRAISGIDLDELLRAGVALLTERPMTGTALSRALAERYPGYDARSLGYAVQYLVPLVQLPPRGVWGKTLQATWAPLDSWLGKPVEAGVEPDGLVVRYLHAFGPASAADVRTWSGLMGAREVLERLRPSLRTFRDERGRQLFDVEDGPLPDAETPAPPRFLADYDNVWLAHADRSRMVSDAHRERFMMGRTGGPNALLIDGFARAAWRLDRDRARAILHVSPLDALTPEERREVANEGAELLRFLAPEADHDVTFAAPD